MEIKYHGHSCVQISNGGQSLLIDPFMTGNPKCITKPKDVQVDYVLLTHAHPDHISDALPIAKANDASIVAIYELANYMSWQGAKTVEINMGGTVDLGFAKVQMVQAFHSSGIFVPNEQKIIYGGMPGGFIIRWNGKTILHSGDTSLFLDMKLIGERNDIDLAFLPIGDTYTMGPDDAALAAEWLRAKRVVPVHYNTFDAIKQEAESYVQLLSERGIEGAVMRPGDTITL